MSGPINVRLPKKIVRDLDDFAKEYELSRSEVIRQALTFYLTMLKNIGNIIRPTIFRVMPSQVVLMKRGDVTLMKLPTGLILTLSYTSSGGIGPKPMDKVKVDGFTLGRFMTRVVLMDTIAINSWPRLIVLTLSVEMSPTGIEILEGVKGEAKKIGLDPEESISMNTEENVNTDQTGLGAVALGLVHEDELRIGRTQPNDALVIIGTPKVGEEVLQAEREGKIADLQEVLRLLQLEFVHDVVPIDTQGIAYEARMVTQMVGRQVKFYDDVKMDLDKPAGPATAVLVTMDEEKIERLAWTVRKPITVIGKVL
ncbi:MAG: ribbon-helix-helix domain-containing protein [Candidatus Methylarchaceae archaeon HK02M1]|nr:ribbon-helix-helix domain-containing protein [Candidatus Methylarchaceae archaeon HK02M1]